MEVDDGSAVIDCNYRHPVPQPPRPDNPRKAGTKPYSTPENNALHKDSNFKAGNTPLPAAPIPVAYVGTSVRIVGRVTKWNETRLLNVDKIGKHYRFQPVKNADTFVYVEPCLSSNDEPTHWLAVCNLHRTHYFSSSAGPFTIPQSTQPPQAKFKITNASSSKPKAGRSHSPVPSPIPDPQTPSRSSVANSSAHTSPVSIASSPQGPQVRILDRRHKRRLIV